MCIALPVRIIKINGHFATVDLGNSETSQVDISIVDAKLGDYLIVNTGYAIRVVEKAEALETIDIWKKMKEIYKDEK